MDVIATVCAAFGLTVSETKTEHVFARKGDVRCHLHIQRRGCRPGIQTNARFRMPRADVNHHADLSIEIDR